MAIHDWTRVPVGVWHDFHHAWTAQLRHVLNDGLLPEDYYSLAERFTGPMGPDIPSVRKRVVIVIRHVSDDRIVGLLEILTPANKASRHTLRSFVEKAVEGLYRGYHLLLIDLFPPGGRDPNGIHGAIWSEFADGSFELPPETPLTLVSYSAGARKRASIELTAVGRELVEMPLFLEPETYVNVPLEPTYQAAYRSVPRRWKGVLEGAVTRPS